jgi:uncharacterized repeat protein (TIGR03803 family)
VRIGKEPETLLRHALSSAAADSFVSGFADRMPWSGSLADIWQPRSGEFMRNAIDRMKRGRVAWLGVAVGLFCISPMLAFAAPMLNVLHAFCSQKRCADGAGPAGVVQDSAGNLYGVSYPGGANNSGTIYEIAADGNGQYTQSVLYSFCSTANCTDGSLPMGNLVIDKKGNLYGITDEGGANGPGEVFELSHKGNHWKLDVLYSFCAQKPCTDGSFPVAGLTYAGAASGAPYDGKSPLYGTAGQGGTGAQDAGVAYELRRGKNGWTEQVIYNFCSQPDCIDGMFSDSPLISDASANLYGTTRQGGSGGFGTAFELSSTQGAWSEAVLYNFCSAANCSDGAHPAGGLTLNAQGTLFGSASDGGIQCADADHGPCGTLFSIQPNGASSQYSTIYTFGVGGRADDGANPDVAPVLDKKGNLFGTTEFGGAMRAGVVFELSGSNLRPLYAFCSLKGCLDGAGPAGAIVDKAGKFFGTTAAGGGNDSNGVAYELTP